MKLDMKAVANSFAAVTAIAYAICIVLFLISPDFAVTVINYFAHGVNIASIVQAKSIVESLLSLVFGTISAWLLAALFVIIHNKLAK